MNLDMLLSLPGLNLNYKLCNIRAYVLLFTDVTLFVLNNEFKKTFPEW